MPFGFRNARDDAMRWTSTKARDDAMRFGFQKEKPRDDAMRFNLPYLGINGYYGIHGPNSIILVFCATNEYFKVHGAMRCDFCLHGAMRCDFQMQITRDDAMRCIFQKTRGDAMRCSLGNSKHGTMRCDGI